MVSRFLCFLLYFWFYLFGVILLKLDVYFQLVHMLYLLLFFILTFSFASLCKQHQIIPSSLRIYSLFLYNLKKWTDINVVFLVVGRYISYDKFMLWNLYDCFVLCVFWWGLYSAGYSFITWFFISILIVCDTIQAEIFLYEYFMILVQGYKNQLL